MVSAGWIKTGSYWEANLVKLPFSAQKIKIKKKSYLSKSCTPSSLVYSNLFLFI